MRKSLRKSLKEKDGFIVIDLNELTGQDLMKPQYKLPDGHPNENAWNLITPAIIKRLSL